MGPCCSRQCCSKQCCSGCVQDTEKEGYEAKQEAKKKRRKNKAKKSDAKEGSGEIKSILTQETVRDAMEREVDRRTSITQHLDADNVSSVEIESELVNQNGSSDRSSLDPNRVSGGIHVGQEVCVKKDVTLSPDAREERQPRQ